MNGVMKLSRDPLLRSVCAAGQPPCPQVSRCIGLSGSDRRFPELTGRSGTQRARRPRSHSREYTSSSHLHLAGDGLRPVRAGKRTLPLDGELVAALTALRKRQLEESTTAGAAYRSRLAELDWYQGGEYVITDEAGTPVHPEWYSDEFGRLLRRAGLRRITLHDSRHTTLTLMERRGVASDASFGGSGERVLPAMQRAALEQRRSHGSSCTARDLGCHHLLASSRTMMQPVRLQQVPA